MFGHKGHATAFFKFKGRLNRPYIEHLQEKNYFCTTIFHGANENREFGLNEYLLM